MGEHELTLWRLYSEGKDNNAREELVTKYTELARTIAAKQYGARYSDDVEFDDYYQFALVGLLEAVDRYDPDHEASFSTYASYRIRGSIISGVQQLSERREQAAFQARAKRERIESIQQDLKLSDRKERFNEMVELSVGLAIGFMLEDIDIVQQSVESSEDQTLKSGLLHQLKMQLARCINELPDRERLIIRYHYFCHFSFQEIANILEVGKARVSQLHKRALQLIQGMFHSNSGLDDYY